MAAVSDFIDRNIGSVNVRNSPNRDRPRKKIGNREENAMKRFSTLFFLTIGLGLIAQPALFADTYYVGNGSCHSTSPYTTITAAVAAAPAGSTVEVCPGTYAEQVYIVGKPLTLKGITDGNSNQVVITVPSTGLGTTTDLLNSEILAPQVYVATDAGPVNISNITVDGTGYSPGANIWLIGIYYFSGTPGTINEVTVRNLSNSGYTTGIWAENGSTTKESVTIENSSIHNVDSYGVFLLSNQTPPTLTATVKGNYVAANLVGIYFVAAGSADSNFIVGSDYGIILDSTATAENNTVANAESFGILAEAAGDIVKSNTVLNSSYGIYLNANGTTIKSNKVTNSNAIGIALNCYTATVASNTINDAPVGLYDVPSFSGSNTFDNVPTVQGGGCPSDASHVAKPTMRPPQIVTRPAR